MTLDSLLGDSATDHHGRAALAWLDAHLERFTPWRETNLSMEGLQALAELSIALARLRDAPQAAERLGANRTLLNRWYEHIVTEITHPRTAELPRKRPIQAFPYLLPYLVLRRTGWTNPFYERTLDLLHAWGFPQAQEMVPYRELDVAYFLTVAGRSNTNLMGLYRRTFLARAKGLVHVDHESAYSITHTILYLSDFGARRVALQGDDLEHAREIVACLVVHYWRTKHWDLLGEMLLCTKIIGCREPRLASLALAAFHDAHAVDGSISGRAGAEEESAAARLKADSEKLFTTCYHTTLVSLLLAIQLLQDAREHTG